MITRFATTALLLLASFAANAQSNTPPTTVDMASRVQACVACHGAEGRASAEGYYPRIAGKPAGYLFNQLQNFRDHRRVNAQMTYLAQRQPDAYLMEIAEHFARQDQVHRALGLALRDGESLLALDGRTYALDARSGQGSPFEALRRGVDTVLGPAQRGLGGAVSRVAGAVDGESEADERLQEENARLKKMFADLSLVHEALKDAVAKKL